MIEICNHQQNSQGTWQTEFVELLPELEKRLRRAFRQLDAEACEDATEEGVIHSLLAFVRLHDQGRTHSVSASTLAWYAAKQIGRGRTAVGRLNSREPLSRYAQIGNGIRLQHEHWIESLIDDKRAPVADQVAMRVDAREWLATLSRRTKQIAKDLAVGCSTSEVARKHGLSAGRISQLRRKLHASWLEFQHEDVPALI
jgi:hypothetical protein